MVTLAIQVTVETVVIPVTKVEEMRLTKRLSPNRSLRIILKGF
jgi:hypothetical protein